MADASTPPAPTSPAADVDAKEAANKIVKVENDTSAKKETSTNNVDSKEEPTKANRIEKITTLPAIITDEEGTAIPEASNGASMYQYRDFSNVPEEELEQQPMTAPPPPPSRGPVESSIRVQKFPVKLYAILAQKEFADIICWMPHGRSWKVLKPNLFESLVMPLFFEYSNYHSFNRLVNAWSFRRISSGPDRGSYYHELFLRGKPYLQKYMRRLPKTHKKLPMKKEDEPDFYAMDKENPLPTVDEAPLPPGVTSESQMMRPGGMSPLRGGGAHDMMVGHNCGGMMGPGAMGGMGSYKDPLLSRHHPMGMGMNSMGMMGAAGMSPMGGMGMNMMSAGGMGMSNMNMMSAGGMGGMGMDGGMMSGGMSGMSSMGGMGMGSGMSSMGGAFRDSQFGGHGAASDMEFHRLRHIQQMHMLDRQMGTGTMSSADQLDRMRNMEMRLGGGR